MVGEEREAGEGEEGDMREETMEGDVGGEDVKQGRETVDGGRRHWRSASSKGGGRERLLQCDYHRTHPREVDVMG